jgi:hypothetical protein
MSRLTRPIWDQLVLPSNLLVARSLFVHLARTKPLGSHPFQVTSKGNTRLIIMYPLARSNPEMKSRKTNSSQEKDLAVNAMYVLPAVSNRIPPAPISVAVESIPALVVLVYQ